MKKLLLLGLEKNTNLGDGVIAACTKYLVDKILAEINIPYSIDSLDIMEDNYNSIPEYDILIFVGGGIIKYRYQKFYDYIDKITAIAELHNIPVLFHAVGVEGYDSSNVNCIQLKNALNRSCVKSITVRDDIQTLKNCYITNPQIFTQKIADSAVWTKSVYRIEKKEKNIIGLGVIREGIFESNGLKIERNKIFELWAGIIMEIEKRNQEWKIFTNGWSSDMKFAINLMKYLNREAEIEKNVIPIPQKTYDLVNTISQFKGIIAGRLHANIISYSLGIPSIGIIWNDKCKFWGEIINYPERFFGINEFIPKKIVHQCFQSIQEGYEKTDKEQLRNTCYFSLKKLLEKILVK